MGGGTVLVLGGVGVLGRGGIPILADDDAVGVGEGGRGGVKADSLRTTVWDLLILGYAAGKGLCVCKGERGVHKAKSIAEVGCVCVCVWRTRFGKSLAQARS